MKSSTFVSLVTVFIGGVLPLSATPFNPEQVSGQANWYLHADMNAMKQSEAGEVLMKAVTEEHGQQARAFARMFSFNPLEDVAAITAYGRDDKAVLLVHAKIDPAHLADLVTAADNHKASDHQGTTVHEWTDQGSGKAGAIVSENLVVLADSAELVSKALDVLAGRKESVATDYSPLGDGRAPIVMAVGDLSEIEGIEPDAAFLREASSVRMELGERAGRLEALMEVVTKDPSQAVRLSRVLNGVLALGELASPELAALGLQAEMTGDNQTGRMSGTISMPSELVVELLESAIALQQGSR